MPAAIGQVRGRRSWMAAFAAFTLHPAAFAGAPHGSVTVPLQIRDHFPVITVRIDGRDLPLMYDLGGDFSLALTDKALALVETSPVEGTYTFSDVKGNIIEAPMFEVREIDVGGVLFHGVRGHADRSDPSYPRTDIGDMGILGQPFFESKRIVLDYARGRMTIIPGDSEAPESAGCRGTAVSFLPEWEGAPVTKAITDIGELTLIWDTGAPVSIIRGARAPRFGAKGASDVVTSERLILGGTDFGPLEWRLLDYQEPQGSDGFIGHSFFASHIVCIDFPAKRLLVRAP